MVIFSLFTLCVSLFMSQTLDSTGCFWFTLIVFLLLLHFLLCFIVTLLSLILYKLEINSFQTFLVLEFHDYTKLSISSIFQKFNNHMTMQRNDSFHQPKNLNLIDDSLLEDSNVQQHNSLHISSVQPDNISTGSSEEIIPFDDPDTSIIASIDSPDSLSFQGCVRRKTVLKDGRKPTVASWQRYWLQIWANSLVYFPPKSFKGWECANIEAI